MNPDVTHPAESRHVLFVDHTGTPGGGQLGMRRYAEHPSRHQRDYLFLAEGPVVGQMRTAGARVDVLSPSGDSLRDLLAHRATLRSRVDSGGYDIVIANSFRAAVALAIAHPRTKMAYYARQDTSFQSTGVWPGLIARLAIYPQFKRFIVNSHWTATQIPRRLRPRTVETVARPVCGISHITADPPPSHDILQIAWVGRIVEWKGLHLLLDAVDLLVDRGIPIRVKVAGDAVQGRPEYFATLRRRVVGHALPVDFLGHVQNVDELLRSSDILVHSSVRGEPFGQVIVQGLAANCAVIASTTGGPAEILEDRVTGLLYRTGDSRQLAECIEFLAHDRNQLRMISSAGAVRAKDFTDNVTSSTLDEAIQEACEPSEATAERRP